MEELKSEYFESFLQEKGKNIEVLKKLSDEIYRKFGVDSLLGIAQKGNIEELYFCVTLPTEVSQQQTATRINDALNFPLDYDQLENGRRTKFIATTCAVTSALQSHPLYPTPPAFPLLAAQSLFGCGGCSTSLYQAHKSSLTIF